MRIQRWGPLLSVFALVTLAFPVHAQTDQAQARRIRVGGNVQRAKLVKQIHPTYPPLARQARIQGTVRLQVVIGNDGTIQQAEVISGHPLLAPAALEAVRQWEYEPTLLNGEPMEVLTTVDMVFTLTGNPAGSEVAPRTPASERAAESPPTVSPPSPEMQRVFALLQQWEVDAAIRVLRDAIQLQPENLQLRLNLARVLLRNKREVAGAISEYSYVLNRENSLALCRDLAEIHQDTFDLEAAARQFRACLNLDTTDEQSWFRLAFVLYEKGDADTATTAFREAAATHPDPANLHMRVADGLAKSMRPAAALAQAREAIRMRPSAEQAVALLDRLLREQTEGEVLIARLRGYLSLNPNSMPAWQRLARTLFLFDDADGAIAAWRECIDREPNSADYYRPFAQLVATRRGMDVALTEMKAYVSLYPNSPGAHQVLAWLLLTKGDVQEALSQALRAVELDPENRDAHDLLAVAQGATGNPHAARQARERMKTLSATGRPQQRTADPELNAYLRGGQPPGLEANETSAVGSLRMINTACVQYHVTNRAGFPPSLASLGPANPPSAQQANLIDAATASGSRNGYLFIYVTGPTDEQGRVVSYQVYADPAQPGITGNRYFFTDQTGVIRVATGGRASASSPPIQ